VQAADWRWAGEEEAGGRGVGTQDPGAVLGDAARRCAVAGRSPAKVGWGTRRLGGHRLALGWGGEEPVATRGAVPASSELVVGHRCRCVDGPGRTNGRRGVWDEWGRAKARDPG